jgi:hypothetical protein
MWEIITTLSMIFAQKGTLWPRSYGSWNYNSLCNQCLSPLTLRVRIPIRRGVLDTTLCDKVCQWFVTRRWFSPGIPLSSTKKADRHDIAEILSKVALSHINQTKPNLLPNIYLTWVLKSSMLWLIQTQSSHQTNRISSFQNKY